MLVSIIVPIYNGAKHLDICLKSIIEQSYTKYELILINDGSTDDSLSICRNWELKDKRVKVYSKKNGGVSSARNMGMEMSQGDYILFVDCDDLLSKDYLSKMMRIIKNEGHDVLPVSVIRFIGEKEYFEVKEKEQAGVKTLEEGIVEIYDRHLFNIPWNKLYRRENIIEFNLSFREDISLGEDILFNVAYLSTGKIQRVFIIEDNVYYYRAQNTGNLCNKYDNNYFRNQMEQFQAILSLFKRLNVDSEQSTVYDYYNKIISLSPNYYWEKAPKYKLKFANKMLRTKEYKNCLERRKNSMHKLTWHIYNSGNFLLVRLVEKIYASIHR